MPKPIERVSLSMPRDLLQRLDAMNEKRGFSNRSQAIAELISRHLSDLEADHGERIMTGTITLVYEHSRNNLQRKLADIQYRHIAEVISSLHVLLEQDLTMEVLLVQGPGRKLSEIANELIACKGVKNGELKLVSAILPPIHSHQRDP